MQSIGSLIKIQSFQIVEEKPLTNQQKRWMLQNEIFALLLDDWALKRENWHRYVSFLKKYRIHQAIVGAKECHKRWKRCKDADVRFIKPINTGHGNEKRTLGFFTSHLNEEALHYVLSVCKDKIRRDESPTCYILSLNKFSTDK